MTEARARRAALAEVEPAAWDDLLGELGCPDVYFQRAYLESACLLEPGRPAYLRAAGQGGDVLFAGIVRALPAGTGGDVVTPYGYGGPIAVGASPPVERFFEAYERWCAEQSLVTSFVRFHPLLGNHGLAPPSMHVERLAGTVGWRLDEGDLLAGMDGKHRNTCRKALRAGVSVSAQPAPEGLGGFVPLYEETMRRQEAAEFYFFPERYWQSLTTALRERVVVFDATLEGELVASALCLASKPWLHYHLGATAEQGRAVGAGNLLLYEAARWAQERGYETFHLGGGVGGRDDSLLAHKLRFSPGGRREAWIGKAIHDPAAYRELTGRDAGFEGYFPAYRRPPG